jgi:hypothetical protein
MRHLQTHLGFIVLIERRARCWLAALRAGLAMPQPALAGLP